MSSPAPTSTLLVVDDNPRSLLMLSATLRRDGYRIVEAEDGFAALQLAAQVQPDAIILDVMMPDMDGFEVCRRLRSDPALESVPVLLLTALDDRDSRLAGLEAGADEFISKPFDSSELRTRLRTITRLNRFRRLSEQAARFESSLANAPDPIAVVRQSGEFLIVNTSFEKLVPEARRPATFEQLFTPETRDTWVRWLDGVHHFHPHRLPFETTLAVVEPGRAAPIVEITAALIPWERDHAYQFNLRDVTEKRQLEASLMQAQRLDLLGHLAGGIVHDVNNILAAVSGNAQLMDFAAGDDNQEYAENIINSANQGVRMLRKLLAFARGSDGESVATDLRTIAREVTTLIRKSFGMDYQLKLEADDEVAPVLVEPTHIHQILMNLAVNARDAMPTGGRITVRVTTRTVTDAAPSLVAAAVKAGAYTVLEVADTGPGIPDEVRAHLFEPFFSTKGPDHGTGLGLATVMSLTQRHGGHVTVDTQPGKGACFQCFFPALAAS